MKTKQFDCPRNGQSIPLKITFLLALLCGLFILPATAQTVEMEVSQFHFEVTAPAATLMEGESATFTVVLGAEEAPVADALGFNIELELAAFVTFPSSTDIDLSNSWFTAGDSSETTLLLFPEASTLSLEASSPEAQSGYGTLFEFTLVANEDNVEVNQMISSAGGLVTVEIVGFKQGTEMRSPAPQPVLLLYPNPCRDQLSWKMEGEKPHALSVIDGLGRVVLSASPEALHRGWLSVGTLSRGSYFVILETKSTGLQTRTLQIE